ncbi:MAG TPA: hypothetical protein VE086_07540 [Chthoniobacterales bacterium]|nr:hypothetical protein [Chthoniobacterales bacterium]
MKITQLAKFTLVFAALAIALPARGDTMSVPSKEAPAYTFDAPSSWKPKANKEDESVEATAPGDHAYLSAWIRKNTDSEAIMKDMDATLKDALKSIDDKSSDQTIDVNGTKIMVVKGSGVDKRAGNKVQFRVAIFDAGGGNTGIIYADYDNDAPDSTMKDIQAIIGSIKVVAKK